tara:strand:+ start:64 stop:594 length:531 start_codon:yes stop_codon:yes gene_type:complete
MGFSTEELNKLMLNSAKKRRRKPSLGIVAAKYTSMRRAYQPDYLPGPGHRAAFARCEARLRETGAKKERWGRIVEIVFDAWPNMTSESIPPPRVLASDGFMDIFTAELPQMKVCPQSSRMVLDSIGFHRSTAGIVHVAILLAQGKSMPDGLDEEAQKAARWLSENMDRLEYVEVGE